MGCIMELFTFVHIGGKLDKIRFVPVLRKDQEDQDLKSICHAFDTFDARACACYLPEDKERMLNIICAAYEGVDGFNEDVRAIFRATQWRDELHIVVHDRSSFGPMNSESKDT